MAPRRQNRSVKLLPADSKVGDAPWLPPEGRLAGQERTMLRFREIATRRGNRRWAIRAFCVECMGGSLPDVKDCTSPNCPLYPFRLGLKEVK